MVDETAAAEPTAPAAAPTAGSAGDTDDRRITPGRVVTTIIVIGLVGSLAVDATERRHQIIQ